MSSGTSSQKKKRCQKKFHQDGRTSSSTVWLSTASIALACAAADGVVEMPPSAIGKPQPGQTLASVEMDRPHSGQAISAMRHLAESTGGNKTRCSSAATV